MTARKFADATGIAELWSKVKSYISGVLPTKTSDLTNDSGYITSMTILSYGNSTWQDFIDAYDANKVVYCRASSNSNPASGSQTRLAFMAYVNNAATPTEVEFQYYRSVSSHTNTQQGDQVYVYKLNSSGTWSVTTREAYTKMVVNNGITSSYITGTSASMTISLADAYGDTKNPYGTKTANYVLAGPTSGSAAAPSFRALVAADIPDLSDTYLTSYTETDPTVPSWAKESSKPSYDASEVGAVPTSRTVNGKALSSNIALDASDVGAQPTLVSGTNIKTINNESVLGSGNITVTTVAAQIIRW